MRHSMIRMAAAARWDISLQFRNGFYAAVTVMTLLWIGVLRQLPPARLQPWLPILVQGNLLINTFYFVGGLLLLEKGEGTLTARSVTPLRSVEFLLTRSATLTLLALLENTLIVWLVVGPDLNPLAWLAGVGGSCLLLTLAGFLVVVRYDAINDYLLPSMLYAGLLTLPQLALAAGWQAWPLYLHPLQGPLLLLQAAWQSQPAAALAAGVATTAAWTMVALTAATRAYRRFVMAAPEARR